MALLVSVIVEVAELQSQLSCAAAGAGHSLVKQPLSWSLVCLMHSQPEKNVKNYGSTVHYFKTNLIANQPSLYQFIALTKYPRGGEKHFVTTVSSQGEHKTLPKKRNNVGHKLCATSFMSALVKTS